MSAAKRAYPGPDFVAQFRTVGALVSRAELGSTGNVWCEAPEARTANAAARRPPMRVMGIDRAAAWWKSHCAFAFVRPPSRLAAGLHWRFAVSPLRRLNRTEPLCCARRSDVARVACSI